MGDELLTKDEGKEMMGIVTAIRKKCEEFGATSLEFKTYSENAEKRLKELDTKNESLVKDGEKNRAIILETKERVEHLETLKLAGAAVSANSAVAKADMNDVMNALLKNNWIEFINAPGNEKKAIQMFSAMTKNNYDDAEGAKKMASFIKSYGVKASNDLLRSDIGELGGFLCPPEYSNELNKNIIEYSPLRRYVRVRRTGSKSYKEPLRVGIPVATWPGEARSGSKSISNYIMNEFTPQRLTNTIGVTEDELMFNGYNLASELLQDNAEAFAVAEGQAFFNGNGLNKPLGWSVAENVPEYVTVTTSITFDDLIKITGELKQGYNPMYSFNRRTLAQLRQLKDENERYLWNPAFGDAASGSPATINGFRYSGEFIEYDEFDTADGFPILFADMLRFYQMVDRSDMTIIRDVYTQKTEGIVEFTMNKWTHGKPKIYEAGIRMKLKS